VIGRIGYDPERLSGQAERGMQQPTELNGKSVVLSLLPNKGLPLPFISLGGSSLMATLLGVGILLNISSHLRDRVEL